METITLHYEINKNTDNISEYFNLKQKDIELFMEGFRLYCLGREDNTVTGPFLDFIESNPHYGGIVLSLALLSLTKILEGLYL